MLDKFKRNKRKPHIAIYTAIFGNKDDLHAIKHQSNTIDYYCFTDNPGLTDQNYRIIVSTPLFEDPVRSAKVYKILPHVFLHHYEYTIWVDGCVDIIEEDMESLISKALAKNNISFFPHPNRDCIYEEAQACIQLKKDNSSVIQNQMDHYRSEGYPEHNGLIAGTVILRRNNSCDVISMNNAWWAEIAKHSKRDQLSFNFVAWKLGYRYSTLDQELYENEYFDVNFHNHKL